jgi:cytochrome c-type biogenesis protein
MNAGEFALAILAGSLTTLSPCVLPMIPLVVGGAMQANRLAPLAIGAGLVVSFTVLGVLLGVLGSVLGFSGDSFRVFGALLLVTFGIVMLVPALNARFTAWMTPLASSANTLSTGVRDDSLRGAFVLGLTLGMIWTPCSGPLLGSTLTLVASDGGALRGGILLALFGVGAAIPLVAFSYASRAGFTAARDWVLARIGVLRTAFAVLLLVVGVAILTGLDKQLESLILDTLPESWILLTVRY